MERSRDHSPIRTPPRTRKSHKRPPSVSANTQSLEHLSDTRDNTVPDHDIISDDQYMYGYKRVDDEQQRWQQVESVNSVAERAMRAAEEALKPTSLDAEERQPSGTVEEDESRNDWYYQKENVYLHQPPKQDDSEKSRTQDNVTEQTSASVSSKSNTTAKPASYGNEYPRGNIETQERNEMHSSFSGSPGSRGYSPHSRIPVPRTGFQSSPPGKKRPGSSPTKNPPNDQHLQLPSSARAVSNGRARSNGNAPNTRSHSSAKTKPASKQTGKIASQQTDKHARSSHSSRPQQKTSIANWKLTQQMTPSFSREVETNLPQSAQITYLSSQLNIAYDEYVTLASYTKDIAEQLKAVQQTQQKDQSEIKRLRKELHHEQSEKRTYQKNEYVFGFLTLLFVCLQTISSFVMINALQGGIESAS